MESIGILKERILETVQDNLNNKKLLKALKTEFTQKGFNVSVPNLLWSDNLDEDNLDINELISITKVFSNQLKDNRFKLSNYFSEQQVFIHNNSNNIDSNKSDYALFKNVRKIDNKNYLGVITGKQALEMRKNTLYSYFKQFQRAPKLVKTASGRVIKKIDMNIKNVKDMEEEFNNKTMTPTSIHFAVLVSNKKGLAENFKFKKMYEDIIGDLWIKPNFDFESETYLPFMCIDGWHRLTAMTNSVEMAELNKKELECELGCFIHVFDNESDIKKFIIDTFKRCDTDLDYLNSMEPTDEIKFITEFIKNTEWLNGHVAMTRQEMKIETNFVEQKTLIEAFTQTDIEMNDSLQSELSKDDVSEILDSLLNYVYMEFYKEDMKSFTESVFLDNNIFRLYIRFAARVRDLKYKTLIIKLVEYINNNLKSISSELNNRNIDLNMSIEKIISVVINNE